MKIRLLKFKRVQSTNNIAIKLIKKNLKCPVLIKSDLQTKGKGTMGKKWISKKGNLFLSVLFIIDSKKISFKQYVILNALLIKKILSKYVKKNIKIKWPNDLLIEKNKICGILQEVIYHNDRPFLVVGIGINTNFSPKINNYKTASLRIYTKKKVNNDKILKDVKERYERFLNDVKLYNFSYLRKKIK